MIAIIIPITTNTTIATCIQIQIGDIGFKPTRVPFRTRLRPVVDAPSMVCIMKGRLVKLVTTVTLTLCAVVSQAGLSSGQERIDTRASSAPPLGGINIGEVNDRSPLSLADSEIAEAKALHARVVRVELPWSELEPREASQIEPRALAFADRLIADAAARGIRVIMFVDSTPCWDSSAPVALLDKCTPGSRDEANAWPPRNPSPYAAVVAYLVQRYGTRLAAIEIWNEPDQANQLYFAGPNKARRYATLLRAAYPAIKRINPKVPVLAGSLVGSNGVFLQALYAAGIKGYYDGLAVHFYTLTLASLRSFREVQIANGDTKPLWLDEFGWSSCWPQYRAQQEQGCVTPKVQATNITNIFRSLAHVPYLAAETLYQLHGSNTEDFGVLNERNRRKPSFSALAQALASPFGAPSPVTLGLWRRGNHVVAHGSGPVGDYMQLEVLQGNTQLYKATFTLDRFNRYSVALPSVLGTSGLLVRVFQVWMGPSHSAQSTI